VRRVLFISALSVLLVAETASAGFDSPVFRMKLGYSFTTLTAGDQITGQSIGSLLTLMPSILWDVPTLNTRFGVHYLAEVASNFGTLPITGIGGGGEFYPLGISATHEVKPEDVVFQKSRTGPFLYVGVTPVNLSINQTNTVNSAKSIAFSAFMIEEMFAIGVDYPLRQSMILHLEGNFRFGSSAGDEITGTAIKYMSYGVMIGFLTSYY
jgi:hypothetical protein